MADLPGALIYSFSALFVILDPLLSVPIFTSMTQGQSSSEINRQALIAVAVAGFLMYLFLFFNFFIFDTLGSRSQAFRLPGESFCFSSVFRWRSGLISGRRRSIPPQLQG